MPRGVFVRTPEYREKHLMLGLAKDSQDVLLRAADYLKNWKRTA